MRIGSHIILRLLISLRALTQPKPQPLTREEIAFSWIKRGWTMSTGPEEKAEKCFENLRESLNTLNVDLTSDQLVHHYFCHLGSDEKTGLAPKARRLLRG